MGDSDLWRADGSFRGIQGKSGGGKGGKGKGSAPQFTRVIPKFLQKYHEPPAIQAKFAPPPMPDLETEEEELDEVQKAAMEAYFEKDREKKDKIAKAAGDDAHEDDAVGQEKVKETNSGKKKASQAVAGVGDSSTQHPKKKRKRKEMATLSNKKLLSFSMEDEE